MKFNKIWEKHQNIFKIIILLFIVSVFFIIVINIPKKTANNIQEEVVAKNEEFKIEIKMPVDEDKNIIINKKSTTPVTIVNNNDLDVTDVFVSFGLYDKAGNEVDSALYTNWTCDANSSKILNLNLGDFNNEDYNLEVSIKNRVLVTNDSNNTTNSEIINSINEDISDQDIWIYTKYVVEQNLKSPKSADFPYIKDAQIIRNTDSIIVKSYVDAENSFGAKVRSEFIVTLSADGQRAINVIID